MISNLITTHGVILDSTSATTSANDRGVYSLSAAGECWRHLPDDVMFAIPGLVDRSTAMRAFTVDYDSTQPITPKIIAARVTILKQIRPLEKEVETNYNSISMKIHRVLEDAPWANSEDWQEVATAEIVRAIGGKGVLTEFCVHQFLMANPGRFVAQTSDFLENQKFWVRPLWQQKDLETISRWLAVHDPLLEGFYSKAKRLVAVSRERQASSSVPVSRVDISAAFTPEEQLILRVLNGYIRSTRSTQKDPYAVPIATIIKRMGLYEQEIDQSLVHGLLVEMGIAAPWNDPITGERALLQLPSRTSTPAPSTSTSSGSGLGPEELYPHDIVEHVRHDFKDLHAFVIDAEDAQELDDAVSVEPVPSEPGSHWLHVHVADPTVKIHPNHVLAQQARLRFATSYDINSTIPMIPSSFMYDGLSLGTRSQKGLPENVLTFSCKVNELGDIKDYKVQAGLLRNVHVLKYDDVDKFLELPSRRQLFPFVRKTSPEPPSVPPSLAPTQQDELRTLYNIALKMVINRFMSGRFWFSAPQAKISMESKSLPPNPTDLTHPVVYDGFPHLTYEVESQPDHEIGSRRLVAEAMKAACRVASRFCRDRGLPAVRRTSTAPAATDEQWEQALALRDPDSLIDYEAMLKTGIGFPRSANEVNLNGHWVMGVPDGEGYLRVTSPLRRYADLVMHWQIKHALAAGGAPAQPLFSHTWMTSFAMEMTTKERALRGLERRHHNWWALKYIEHWRADPRNLAEGPGPLDDLDAIILRASPTEAVFQRQQQIRVLIPQLGTPALLELRPEESMRMLLKMGDKLPVKLVSTKLGTKPELGVMLRDV